jgi:hypothetical protein
LQPVLGGGGLLLLQGQATGQRKLQQQRKL